MRLKQLGILFLALAVASCLAPRSPSPPLIEVNEKVEMPPTFTPELDFTITATTLPPATATPTLTNTPAPATPEPNLSQPAAIIARVEGVPDSFLLVGGNQIGSWVNAADLEEVLADGGSNFQLYTPFEFQEWVTGQELNFARLCNQHFITIDPSFPEQSAVGVSGEWDVLPRIPQELSTDLDVYLQAITAWQIEQAPSQPIPAINKIWKVDLEGNGTDEVILNGTRYAEPTGHNVGPRDYSVVLMRTVIGSEVVTVELVGDYYTEEVVNAFPLTYNLEFIGDLNGDGTMEILIGVSQWEGTGVMVFDVNGKEVQLVLSAMCAH